MRPIKSRMKICTLFVPVLFLSHQARADESPQAPPQSPQAPPQAAEAPNTGEIIVTAQKRSQSINNVGLTIQAATGQTLQDRGIQGPADLGKLVSGFSFTESLYTTPVYTLRGVGLYDATFGSVPAVAVYTDQFPRNFPVMSDALDLDIERVEVLKGPQGTLFGQSSTGGAVNYILAKPTDHFAAGMDVSYERFGKADISGFVSGPLANGLTARLAVRAVEGGAWQYSESRPNDTLGNQRRLMGRLTLDYNPDDRLKIEFTATGSRDNSDPIAGQYLGTVYDIYSASALAAANSNPKTANPYGIVNNAEYNAYTNPNSPAYDASFLTRQATLVGRLDGTDPYGLTGAAGAQAILGTPTSNNARAAEWDQGLLTPEHNTYYQFALRADYKLGDSITVSSLSALARKKLDYSQDLDATTAQDLEAPQMLGDVKTFNQELRLAGNTDQLHWIVGGSYDNNRTVQNNLFAFGDESTNNPIGVLPIRSAANDFTTTQKTYGAFANAEYKILSRLTAQAGVRFTRNDQTASYCYNDPASDAQQATSQVFSILQRALSGNSALPAITPGQCFALGDGYNGTTLNEATLTPLQLAMHDSDWSYRAGLTYKLDGGALLYANISQGVKAGVYSSIGAASTKQYAPALPERLVAYEAGFKVPLLDRRLRINGAGFYYDYRDKQIRGRVLDPIFGLLEKMVNVPKSYVLGAEGDITATPIDGLTLSVNATYLKAKVDGAFSETADGNKVYNSDGYSGNFNGATLPFSPKFSGNADAQYEWNIGHGLRTFVGGTLVRQGSQNATYASPTLLAPDFEIKGWTTVDLRAGVRSTDGRWMVTAFGRNVFNQVYTTAISSLIDTRFRFTGMPVTYGISLKLRV